MIKSLGSDDTQEEQNWDDVNANRKLHAGKQKIKIQRDRLPESNHLAWEQLQVENQRHDQRDEAKIEEVNRTIWHRPTSPQMRCHAKYPGSFPTSLRSILRKKEMWEIGGEQTKDDHRLQLSPAKFTIFFLSDARKEKGQSAQHCVERVSLYSTIYASLNLLFVNWYNEVREVPYLKLGTNNIIIACTCDLNCILHKLSKCQTVPMATTQKSYNP